MIEPTRRRGFSEPYGSWKIIWISRRYGRIARRDRFGDVARRRTSPGPRSPESALRRSGRAWTCRMPVSPTRPRVLPRGIASDTSSTAWTWPTVRRTRPPRADWEVLHQVLDPDQHVVRVAAARPRPMGGAAHPATLPSDPGDSGDPGDLGFDDLGGRLAAAFTHRLGPQLLRLARSGRPPAGQPARRAVVAVLADRPQPGLFGQAPVHARSAHRGGTCSRAAG